LDPTTQRVVDSDMLLRRRVFNKENLDNLLLVVGYSLTPDGPEHFASYGLLVVSVSDGLPLFTVTSRPRSTYVICCFDAIESYLKQYLDFYETKY